MSERDEELLGRLLRHLARPGRKLRVGCPEEEDLAAYMDGGLAETRRSELESHLADCALCLDDLLAAHKAGQRDLEEKAPARVMARAMALLHQSARTNEIFNLVVELARDSLELISTSGRLVMPALAAEIRGKGRTADGGMLRIEKDLGKLQIAVEIERLEDDLCQVAVHVKSNGGSVADGLRISLMSGEREQASYLARQGSAIFDRIPPGEYQLGVIDAGCSLGAIELTIKEDGHERERKTS